MSKHGKQKVYAEYKLIEKFMGKDGSLKTKKMSKDERLRARSACTHHILKKNGSLKSMTIDNMDGTVTCRICGQRFSATAATKKEIKGMTKQFLEQVNLSKWIGQAGGIDDKTMSFLCGLSLSVTKAPKVIGRVQKLYMRSSSAKKKKDKKGDRFGRNSASTFGSWEAK